MAPEMHIYIYIYGCAIGTALPSGDMHGVDHSAPDSSCISGIVLAYYMTLFFFFADCVLTDEHCICMRREPEWLAQVQLIFAGLCCLAVPLAKASDVNCLCMAVKAVLPIEEKRKGWRWCPNLDSIIADIEI